MRTTLKKGNEDFIIGVDEVGRGAVAGPVAVGAVLMTADTYHNYQTEWDTLRDSKKLTQKGREKWCEYISAKIAENTMLAKCSQVQATTIDKIGIVKSVSQAANKSISSLLPTPTTTTTPNTPTKKGIILCDAGIKIKKPAKYQVINIIRGDEKEPIIALASIWAKVFRDKLMLKHSKNFDNYGFDKNKGYGTKSHLEAIRKNGTTIHHRTSFLKMYF
ncbi:MAG: ribonuclease HII [Candidatus Campbellbacteria bacterium]|nr:ribonuclease HII [Candidatus Campbellbacteria bacterium]